MKFIKTLFLFAIIFSIDLNTLSQEDNVFGEISETDFQGAEDNARVEQRRKLRELANEPQIQKMKNELRELSGNQEVQQFGNSRNFGEITENQFNRKKNDIRIGTTPQQRSPWGQWRNNSSVTNNTESESSRDQIENQQHLSDGTRSRTLRELATQGQIQILRNEYDSMQREQNEERMQQNQLQSKPSIDSKPNPVQATMTHRIPGGNILQRIVDIASSAAQERPNETAGSNSVSQRVRPQIQRSSNNSLQNHETNITATGSGKSNIESTNVKNTVDNVKNTAISSSKINSGITASKLKAKNSTLKNYNKNISNTASSSSDVNSGINLGEKVQNR